MKRYYYITVIAIVALLCLQVSYVENLYRDYIEQKVSLTQDALELAITKELHLRSRKQNRESSQFRLYIKAASDMTSQERDSLWCSTAPGDTLNLDNEWRKNIGKTRGEILQQWLQDKKIEEGNMLRLATLDSLYSLEAAGGNYRHVLLLYDADKQLIASAGNLQPSEKGHYSKMLDIGTKGLYAVQVKSEIPMSAFLKHLWYTLILSAAIVVIVLLCLVFQLTEIRRKDALLRKRENSVNGTIHDLKAPLNGVLAMLDWFKQGEKDPVRRKVILMNETGVKHLVANIESLLIVARKDRRKLVLRKTQVDVAALAYRIKEEMDVTYGNKPHTLTVRNELPEGCTVRADAMYLENVLRNLVENALKYADEGVKVEIVLTQEADKFSMAVSDNGWGIPARYQKKIFRQFYQVPREADRLQKGYGIGLTQAKYIIDEHGGTIGVLSTEGKGSVFTVTLPL